MVGPKPSRRDSSEPYTWNGGTIKNILSKPEYCGHTVNFLTRKESYKDKNFKWNPKEEWKVFPNTHEAIIDQETFDTVQRLRGTPRRVDTIGEANPLTGILFCAQCGAKMYNSRQSKAYFIENRFGKEYKHKTSDHYSCSTYDLGKGAFKSVCSQHFIRTSVVRELVLDMIRRVSGYVRENEGEFIERLREASTVRQTETAKSHKKLLARNERRISELDGLFRKVYEDNASGKLSDERFEQLSCAYESEQSELKAQNTSLQAELDAFNTDSVRADRFIEIVRRYTEFDTLTNAMLNEFVEKILVHEADKSGDERVQQVDIYFNFIGNFDITTDEAPPTPDELAAQEKRRKKLTQQREANRRWYAEQKRKAGLTPEELEAEKWEKQARKEPLSIRQQKRREYQRAWRRRQKERKLTNNTEPA